MSPRCGLAIAALALLAAVPALAQYTGKVTEKTKDTPTLRAVGVLEWTGEPGKPKTSRLVPVSIYDGENLQDAGVYLARPQPLALEGEVEYQLKKDGKTIGIFDIKNAGQQQGSWVGFGDWKPVPHPKPAFAATAKIDDEDASDDDKPVLHRRQPTSNTKGGNGSGNSKDSSGQAQDPDRPTLHKSPASDTTQPGSEGTAPVDPDRPVLKEPKPQPPAAKPADDVDHVDDLPNVSDPDRPRLVRGKSSDSGPKVAPSMMGLPPDMQQTVAVSDAKITPDHPWNYSWANPDDEAKMKAQMEDIARQALGLTPPATPAKSSTTTTHHTKKAASPPPPAEPAPLRDEQFKVFELAYGSGATMVLTARTAGALKDEKFVSLIAQPDLYGNVRVLLKSVANGAHLDETPRMRLVDAVDAMADNRGELLFELRGQTQRQFALYRVLRGEANQLFVTAADNFGSAGSE